MIEEQLAAGGPFLFGDRAGVADLAAFLNVWFLRSGEPDAYKRFTAAMPALQAWAARMDAIGHGKPTDMTPEAAFAVAASSVPEPARPSSEDEAQGLKPGMTVAVMPDDYGRNPVTGEIVHVSAQEIAVKRQAEGAGEIVVHFPRAGFLVIKVG